MAQALRKAAPFLVLAGIALMPRSGAAARRPQPPVPPPPPAEEGPSDQPNPNRSTADPGQLHDRTRGRHADSPAEIPAKGWRDILVRSFKEFGDDQAPLVAAGVTFYTVLAIFPALGAFAALYGLFADVAQAQRHLAVLSVILPPEVLRMVGEQLVRLSAGSEGGLSLAFAGGLLLSIWSANGAMKAMITAMNIAYDEKEKRGFVRKTLTSLAFTVGFLLFALAAIAVLAAPAAIEPFAGAGTAALFRWISYPLLLVAMAVGLALLYRFGPSRDRVRWRWITPGSAAAIVLWVVASAAFSIYVANFAHYEKTYGSLGAVIGFLMWLYVSAQVVLLGAELNSEIEHQTVKDTTIGPERPLGERGAVMADTVGEPQ
ncbi:YihY/virulence factor BrkB family protein [Phenylobacterium sp. VNQ135]|uniref:YihY/virulence factor BrkB family protein n=1 Tax=Phenylobacterium sp. VNQ135 TaxID=3400922 RepID=UPI003C124D60